MRQHRDIAVCCVPPNKVGIVMRECQDTIARGVALGDLDNMGDVIERLEDENMQLWVILEGSEPVATFFTDINVEDDGGRFIGVFGLVGKHVMRWAGHLSGAMVAFAAAERCDRVMFMGRPGWARVLPEWRPVRRVGDEFVWERSVLQ